MNSFRHDTLAQRILFGHGQCQEHLSKEVAERESKSVLLIGSTRWSFLARDLPIGAHIRTVHQHVPYHEVKLARELTRSNNVDLILSIGGGSATGLAKSVALEVGISIIAVPTTFASSEATPIWGITEAGRKVTGRDVRVLPKVVIYDSSLLSTLSPEFASASGFNALAHAIDALWAPNADPISSATAEVGIRILVNSLPQLVGDSPPLDDLLFGAYLSATALASAGSGLHHRICHALGGRFDLPHAYLHACLLPHVLAFNLPYAPIAEAALTRGFNSSDPVASLRGLCETLKTPTSLRQIGLHSSDLDEATDLALEAVPSSNPRPIEFESMKALLKQAW